ncbi:MAG: benzoyl-CoA 2,3-epoxidase subunit BoxB [bacterium]|nr:benzoyl-CoA 2,3-epoxidase subunit BoxB [bacterium]
MVDGKVNYDDVIPNNVAISDSRKLQRAIKEWHPKFMKWWWERGPESYQHNDVYLRTAITVDASGWATYAYVRMPEYKWGIFLAPKKTETIHFGDRQGQETWESVPGEHRNDLRRLIVTQADTEPGSVEQQQLLGHSAPSLYDMRNLFQVNVEEGRHLWAMVYLLMQYFGRDGREESEGLLIRNSGDADTPRILTTFNEPIVDWLDFFCFAMFTDRDGKYQLGALAESAFAPLARTTQFMLTEEAFHLFVGETGVGRTIRRTAQLMKETPNEDVTTVDAIPLDIVQKYINYWYSVSLDLFGSEDSSNAANFFGASLKGRFGESNRKKYPDPLCRDTAYSIECLDENGRKTTTEIPMRRAMNAVLRDTYIEDTYRALRRWNKVFEKEDIQYRLQLPSDRFNRKIGLHAAHQADVEGNFLTAEEWEKRKDEWLPTPEDKAYVKTCMVPVREPGKFANWITPPYRGVSGKPIDFEYVRL